jgi:two-component system, chemotaxis family, sensor kinase CheA
MADRTPADTLEALAAAVVEADAEDARSLEDAARALEAARLAGALPPALATEANELGVELAGDLAGEALARIATLLAEAQAPKAVAPAGAASASRDAETIELVGDFLEEGLEGLARADELLLAIEQHGPDTDKTHALFRVFHTVKGVAGFLELGQIVSLAHTTETLLNQVREGRQPLAGEAFDATFEATALLRRLLEALRKAVDAGVALEPDPDVAALVARLGAATARKAEPGEPARTEYVVKRTPEYVVRKEAPAGTPAPSSTPAPTPTPTPAAQPQAGEANAAAGSGGKLRETVKVDLERVDSMVEMIGELIIVESMVVNAPEIAGSASLRLRNTLNQLSKISRDLQNVAMRMRMVPVRGAFQKMGRLVRDLARKTGKDVVLETSGEDTELDRSMVERLEDPLVHLIRNALDHGIEPAAERAGSGKPARAALRLSAFHEGGSIVVELRDDGRGLDREKILKKARERGLVEAAKEATDAEVCGMIFLPGFSTAAQVTEISGRGVGMDVVKRNVEEMRGRVSVSSRPGQGTTFRLILPLTLAIIEGMLVRCGTETYIVPSLSIIESLRPTDDMISRAAGRAEIVNVRGEILPLVRLAQLLGTGEERPASEGRVIVVEGLANKKLGVLVDDVLTQQQVVIKPLGAGLDGVDYLSGAAILADGRVGLILNVDRLASLATRGERSREPLRASA